MRMRKFNAFCAENAGLASCLQESMLDTENGKKRAIRMSVEMKKLSKDTIKVGAISLGLKDIRLTYPKAINRSPSLKWSHSSSNPTTLNPRGWFKTEKKETASAQRSIQRGREFLELVGIGSCLSSCMSQRAGVTRVREWACAFC